MWSILTDPLPEYISVNDIVFGIHTDFRVWLRVGEIVMEAGSEVTPEVLHQLYELTVPEDKRPNGYILAPDFLDALTSFYAGPEDKSEPDPDEPAPAKPKAVRTYDFRHDAGYIYQSFAELYHIRLTEVRMHWWEFLALFDGLMLSEDNSLSFVMGIRQKKISDVPPNQRGSYVRMKKRFALPKPEAQQEAENAVWSKLESMWKENDQ